MTSKQFFQKNLKNLFWINKWRLSTLLKEVICKKRISMVKDWIGISVKKAMNHWLSPGLLTRRILWSQRKRCSRRYSRLEWAQQFSIAVRAALNKVPGTCYLLQKLWRHNSALLTKRPGRSSSLRNLHRTFYQWAHKTDHKLKVRIRSKTQTKTRTAIKPLRHQSKKVEKLTSHQVCASKPNLRELMVRAVAVMRRDRKTRLIARCSSRYSHSRFLQMWNPTTCKMMWGAVTIITWIISRP